MASHKTFSRKISDVTQSVINILILDTSEVVEELYETIKELHKLDFEQDNFMSLVISALAYEDKAEIELGYTGLDVARDYLNTEYEEENDLLASEIIRFGIIIKKLLQDIGAYEDGYLFFQFLEMVDKDIALVRLDRPIIPK